MDKKASRIQSIDTVKVIAIFAVIFIHTLANQIVSIGNNQFVSHQFDFATILLSIFRFAVPFFFIISGYFWGRKIKTRDDLLPVSKAMLKRITLILFAWSIIYLIPYDFFSFNQKSILLFIKTIYWKIEYLITHPQILIFESTKSHLWFLISLLWAVIISLSWLYFFKNINYLIFISISLYIVGVLAKAYLGTPFEINLSFNTRLGPFLSLICFCTGVYLSRKAPSLTWFYMGFLLITTGYVLQFVELLYLKAQSVNLLQEYVFATYFVGLGFALVSLSSIEISMPYVSKLGEYVLGIYACHFIFVDALKQYFVGSLTVPGVFVYPLAVFTLSITLTLAVSKYPPLERILK